MESCDAIVAYAKAASTESASGTAKFAGHVHMANAKANVKACVDACVEICIITVLSVSKVSRTQEGACFPTILLRTGTGGVTRPLESTLKPSKRSAFLKLSPLFMTLSMPRDFT